MTASHALHFIPPDHRRGHVGINQRFLKDRESTRHYFITSSSQLKPKVAEVGLRQSAKIISMSVTEQNVHADWLSITL